MRKAFYSVAALLSLQPLVSASHEGGGMHASDWWFLVFTVVLLGLLALYIYYRVQETGFFTFLPQTAMEEGGEKISNVKEEVLP